MAAYQQAAYHESLEVGEMCISQKREVISLLPKGGKDLRHLKNWRPLTMLNNDYKYLAKSIANRYKRVLPTIISNNQNGFVPGRLLGANIIRTLDIIEYCNEEELEGLLVNIDIEKAFDTVNWNFLYKALKHFNFPEETINMIRCLYTNLEVCTTNNGHMSKFTKVGRGMRQGCPLSPILFVIVIEFMNLYITNTPKLTGITTKNHNHLISQFADDTSFFLLNSKGMLDRLFTQLQNFGRMSGLKLNIGKTEILLLGTSKIEDIPANYRGLVKEEVQSLGIMISGNLKKTTEMNYDIGKKKMMESLKFWQKKQLSLVGKINIVKNQITSKLVHYMSVLPNPGPEFWKRINKKIFEFLANNKKEKLKRSTLINTWDKVGAQMIDLESQCKALKAVWTIRAARQEGPWTDSLRSITGGMPIQDFLSCNLKKEDIQIKYNTRTIWTEIIQE
jgi:hypothetical protein